MIRTMSDAGISLRFAILDAAGDVTSLISVIFQPTLKIYGLVIYGSELGIWILVISLVVYFRVISQNAAENSEEDLVAG